MKIFNDVKQLKASVRTLKIYITTLDRGNLDRISDKHRVNYDITVINRKLDAIVEHLGKEIVEVTNHYELKDI